VDADYRNYLLKLPGKLCEHGEMKTHSKMHMPMSSQWAWEESCPGGEAAFTLCETCGGSGVEYCGSCYEEGPDGVGHGDCPDCVEGLVGHHGWELIRLFLHGDGPEFEWRPVGPTERETE